MQVAKYRNKKMYRQNSRYSKVNKGGKRMTMTKQLNWEGKSVLRKYENPISVFIYNTGGTYYYSFNSLSAAYQQVAFQPNNNAEFQMMANAYGSYYIVGYSLQFTRSLNAATSVIYQLPGIYFDICPPLSAAQQGLVNSSSTVSSDTAYKIQVLNQDSVAPSRYYKLPDVVTDTNGTVCGGRKAAMTTSYSPQWRVLLGYNDFPTQSSTDINRLGSLQINWYVRFSKPIRLNNY